jgi:hypothetical protein
VRDMPRAGCATRPVRSRCLMSTDVIIVSPVMVIGGPYRLAGGARGTRTDTEREPSPQGEPAALPYLILYDAARPTPVAGFV